MDKQNVVQDSLLSLVAEIVLEQSLFTYRKQKLYQQIDESLALGDKKMFLNLTEQLIELLELDINE